MNKMKIEFTSQLQNESFARNAGIAFLLPYNPSVDEVMEVKTILAEAVVNCMIHAYPTNMGIIKLSMSVDENKICTIIVEDEGVGIENVDLAKKAMYTTRSDLERSGMGLTIIESFSDHFLISSTPNQGTTLTITKRLGIE